MMSDSSAERPELIDYIWSQIYSIDLSKNIGLASKRVSSIRITQCIFDLSINTGLLCQLSIQIKMSNPYGGYGGNTGGYGQPPNPYGQQPPKGGQQQPGQWGGQQQPNQWGGQGGQGGQGNQWGQQPGGQWGGQQPRAPTNPYGGQQPPNQFGGQGQQYPPQNQWGNQQPANQWGGQQPQNPYGAQQNVNSQQETQLRQMVDELYVKYDRDRSMTLDRSELASVFNEVLARFNMGFTISQSEAEALIYQIDNNRDGKIGKPELFACLKNLVLNETRTQYR